MPVNLSAEVLPACEHAFGAAQTSEELLADVSSLPGGLAAERQGCRSFTTGEPDVAQAYIQNPLLLKVRACTRQQLHYGLSPGRGPGSLRMVAGVSGRDLSPLILHRETPMPACPQGLHHRKFNLRAYMLISSVVPFVAFMHM